MAITVTPQLLTLFGAITGGSCSYLTLRMFFSPAGELALLGRRLPFTPGLFPYIQPRLADRLGTAVHESLLTPADLHLLATQMVTADKIELAIELVLMSLLSEFRNTTNLHQLARDAGGLASEMMGETLRLVVAKAISGESKVFDIADLVDRATDYLIEEFEVSPKLAGYLADRIFEGPLSAAKLRLRLIEFLTPDAIEALARAIKRYTPGGLGLVLYFVNLRDGLTKFRIFLEDDPERAEQMLAELMERAGVRQTVEREMQAFSLRELPWGTISFLKQTAAGYIQGYLLANGQALVPEMIERLDIGSLVTDAIIRLDPDRIPAPLLARLRSEIAGFIQRYLDRDLPTLLEQLLAGMDLAGLIADKVRRFPSTLLEQLIRETGYARLVTMVLAGAGLGGALGAVCGYLLLR